MSFDWSVHPGARYLSRRTDAAHGRATGFGRFSRCSAVAALLVGLGAAACVDPVSDRYERAADLSGARFGDDERLAVIVRGGRVEQVRALETGGFSVRTRAATPFPSLLLENGTVDDVALGLQLDNAPAALRVGGRIESLEGDGRKDPACARPEFEERVDVLLGPTAVGRADDPTSATLQLTVPRCARVRLETTLDREVERFRVVVVGTIDGDPDYLDAASTAAAAFEADFVQYLGNVAFADDGEAYASFLQRASDEGLPFGVSPGARDLRAAPAAFGSRFGPADALSLIGTVRMLTLDTGDARLSDAQFAFVGAIPLNRPPGFVATHEVLAGFETADGLRSDHQSGRLVSELDARGFSHAFGAGGPRPARRELGSLTLHDLSGGGGSDRRELALVTIERPWPALDPCVTSADCDGFELCNRGFCRSNCDADGDCATGACAPGGTCRPACGADTDCPGPLPECAAGFCELDPRIAVERVAF